MQSSAGRKGDELTNWFPREPCPLYVAIQVSPQNMESAILSRDPRTRQAWDVLSPFLSEAQWATNWMLKRTSWRPTGTKCRVCSAWSWESWRWRPFPSCWSQPAKSALHTCRWSSSVRTLDTCLPAAQQGMSKSESSKTLVLVMSPGNHIVVTPMVESTSLQLKHWIFLEGSLTQNFDLIAL